MGLLPDKIKKIIAGKSVINTGVEGLKGTQTNLPWKNANDEEVFFSPVVLDPKKADVLFPYRLVVYDVKLGKIVGGGDLPDLKIKHNANTGGVQYTIGSRSSWIFTLPITPQQLNITDEFAVNTTATMRGVVEEHNGVKFKTISASGTTGIWPTRSTFEDPNPAGLSLFGGTLSAIGGVTSAFNTLKSGSKASPTAPRPEDSPDELERTGYYQAMLLQQFLEQYAIAKKNPANKDWRLVFDCPKTSESFVVTPVQYTVSRSQRSPGEFLYSMQFKAWKRIIINGGTENKGKSPIPLSKDFFQKTVTTLDNARSLMSASVNVVKAARADYRQVFDQVRKVTLLAKDLGGFVKSVSDFPNQFGKDLKSASKKWASDLKSDEVSSLKGKSGQKNSAIVSAIAANRINNEGVSDDQINAGLLGKQAKDANAASSLNKVFDEPEANFDLLNSIPIDDLDLTPQQRDKIQEEIDSNSLISIEEVKEIKNNMQSLILDLTNNFGAGDAFFSKVYGRPEPKERATPMTLEEFELVKGLEDAVLQLNILTATRDLDDSKKETPLEYVGGLANDSEIPFDSSSTAKILVPVPYGLTIEQISARYLKNPDRYNEIVTLNNLRSPYIDEDGFYYNLLSNGDGRQFNISTKENLYIGQKIQLSSNTVPVFIRKITAIEKITDTNYLLTVDGEDNLSILKLADVAKIKSYLPGTINSQNQIYIPSDKVTPSEARTFDIPFLKDDPLTGLSKIDWLLDENGDVVVNSFGEMSLANGTTNLVQSLKMKVMTQKGTILSNPEFGLGLQPGISVADADIQNILKDLRDMVLQDSRFQAIENIEVNILPPEVSITISAVLADGRGIFPINFSV